MLRHLLRPQQLLRAGLGAGLLARRDGGRLYRPSRRQLHQLHSPSYYSFRKPPKTWFDRAYFDVPHVFLQQHRRHFQVAAAQQPKAVVTATLQNVVLPQPTFGEPAGLSYKALLVDAAGTLFEPSKPVTEVYLELGRKYGVQYTAEEILRRYRRAYGQPWCHSFLRYVDCGRPFWQHILGEATGCWDKAYSEEVYSYYSTAAAWHIIDPHAGEVFEELRRAGLKLAVVSNFDTRLRKILRALHCDEWFDVLAISAEVKAEKPNPTIFLKTCELLGVEPGQTIHVGDDRRNDVWGARDAGCDAWLWGNDVHSFKEVAERIGVSVRTTTIMAAADAS